MQYYFFHLMSWPFLPPDFAEKNDSAWVWLSNATYDPVKGHDLYREYITRSPPSKSWASTASASTSTIRTPMG